jgi:predicted sulfurtransferase
MGKMLLYYKYVDIENPGLIVKQHKKLCAELGLTGRVLIGTEGINGNVGGSDESIEAYKQYMNEHPLFGGIDFKEDAGGTEFFPRMRIAERKEIVSLGIDPQELTVADTGKHLSPEETHQLLTEKPEDLVILDTRNDYETRIGTFKDAIIPPIKNFRDLPQYIDENIETFKDKKVLMFCTGGVRCERASAYLNKKGVAKEVAQINGGIVRYTEAFPDGFFRGKNYVFDARVAVKVTDDILSTCDFCAQPCNDYQNCINALCNKHFIACVACENKYDNCCSGRCQELVNTNQVKRRTVFRPLVAEKSATK